MNFKGEIIITKALEKDKIYGFHRKKVLTDNSDTIWTIYFSRNFSILEHQGKYFKVLGKENIIAVFLNNLIENNDEDYIINIFDKRVSPIWRLQYQYLSQNKEYVLLEYVNNELINTLKSNSLKGCLSI